jgi:branched-subunit amino acid ABC-type transport system permease component
MGVSEVFFGRYFDTSMIDIFAPMIIIFVLLFRPQGLLGMRQAVRV